MSNLLKSKPDDLTPQGSNPTTIIQKIIEVCESGSRATRTGTELTRIKEHRNSVFTYKGQPATYVSGADGVFTFAVLDISSGTPVLHSYTVDGMKKITQGADVSFDSELPAVTSEDNDDVLKVVEGKWAKAEASGGSSLTYAEYTTQDLENWTCDMTFAEIVAVYTAGGIVRAKITLENGTLFGDLMLVSESGLVFCNTDIQSNKIAITRLAHSSADAIAVTSATS